MLLTYFGPGDPLDLAFYNSDSDDMSLDIVSISPTQIVLRNPSNGVVTTVTGTGMPSNPAVLGTGNETGTVTGWSSVTAAGDTVAIFQNVGWTLADLISALEQMMEYDDPAEFLALVSLAPVTIDATEAVDGSDSLHLDGVTSHVTIYTSPGPDDIVGGDGDDNIHIADNATGGDTILASTGNDRYIFLPSTNPDAWVDLLYVDHVGPITVNIDGQANTGSIATSGQGTDTLVDIRNGIGWSGGQTLSIWGTAANDSFTVNGGAGTWIELVGGRGVDSYHITLTGDVRLRMNSDWYMSAQYGVILNLATGVIANDGFGNHETMTIVQGGGRLHVMGTDHADNIIGSAGNEVFILGGGNDTLDGGGGRDLVRYDRSQMTGGVTVDLTAGTAMGTWNGTAFTHSLTGIEDVRGSGLADLIRGSSANEQLDGRDGNDTLVGFGGSDTLYGGDGQDVLNGGDGDDFIFGGSSSSDLRDVIYGGDGNDSADGGWGNDELNGGNGNDTLQGDFGSDTLIGHSGDDAINGGPGADFVFGNDGSDFINGGFASDRINGGAGADRFFHQGVFDHGSDWIQDYSAAEGDVLAVGIAGATRGQFQVNFATTAAGDDAVQEGFVIYRPTGQILWALVDGAGQDSINILIGGVVYDLLA